MTLTLIPDRAPAVWQQVLGGAMDLVNPTIAQVNLDTIATVLARTPRFGGHTERGIYSVGQHCEQGARAILRDTGRQDWSAAFLLHDAHEAFTGDITTPVARALAAIAAEGEYFGGDIVKRAIRTLKSRLDAVIYPAAGIMWPLPEDCAAVVKEYDVRMCVQEAKARLAPAPFPWGEPHDLAEPIEGVDLYPWSEGTVRVMWRAALDEWC